MLHPVDYRLSKNKFWLSTWNSYSLKNYRNLILNDKILNVLGYIFKNCFKASYSFASPWSNPRKYRNYYPNFIIGFDGRRAIRTGPNKVRKLPGFLIPEDYHIIRFSNFIVLKIYFLIDQNVDTYWPKQQKKVRTPIRYLNMRYSKNKNKIDALRFNKNLFISNVEKKNFKSNGYFIYLINLLNNKHVKKILYTSLTDTKSNFKPDSRHLLFRFYNDNTKLLNKIRNNYFLFYFNNKSKPNNKFLLNYNFILKNSNINYIKNISDKIFINFERVKKKNYKIELKNKILNFDYNILNNYKKIKNFKYNKNILLIFNKVLLKKNIQKKYNRLTIKNKIKSFFIFNLLKKSNIKKKKYNYLITKKNSLNIFLKYELLKNKGLFNFNTKTIVRNNKISYLTKKKIFKWSNFLFYIFKNIRKNFFKEKKNFLVSYLKRRIAVYNKTRSFTKNKHYFFIKKFQKRLNLYIHSFYYNNLNKYFYRSKKRIKKKKLFFKKKKNFLYSQYFNMNIKLTKRKRKRKKNIYKPLFVLNNSKLGNSFWLKKKWELILIKNRYNVVYQGYKSNNYFYSLKTLNFFQNFKKFNKRLNYKNFNWFLNSRLKKIEKLINFNKIKTIFLKNNRYLNKKNYYIGFKKLKLLLKLKKWNYFYKFLLLKKNNQNNFKFFKKRKLLKLKGKSKKKKKRKFILLNNKKLLKKVLVGKTYTETNDYNKTKNYNYIFSDYKYTFPLKTKYLKKKPSLLQNFKTFIIEYKPFLRIMRLNNEGFNNNFNNNINYSNSLLHKYDFKYRTFNLNNLISQKLYNSNFIPLNDLLLTKKHNWSLNKDYNYFKFFNLYYKKTFSRGFQVQDEHSTDDIRQTNIRIRRRRRLNKDSVIYLKYKPYSMRSMSRIQRYKVHRSILTYRLYKLNKKRCIRNFYKLIKRPKDVLDPQLWNKKVWKRWNLSFLLARSSGFIKMDSCTQSSRYRNISFGLDYFDKVFDWIEFLKKDIASVEEDPFKLFKKLNKKYIKKKIKLAGIQNIYNSMILEEVQLNYFKRKRWAIKVFDHCLNVKDIIIKRWKPLIFSKSFYNPDPKNHEIYSRNLSVKFIDLIYRKKKYYKQKYKNIYNYKMYKYKYFWNHRINEMSRFFLKTSVNNKLNSFTSFIFKKNLKDKKPFYYKTSNNLSFNKFTVLRLNNIFWSIKELEYYKKYSKIKDKKDFDLRIYNLGLKYMSPKKKFFKVKKQIDRFKPRVFFYWEHLRWFNLFIKSKFNSNISKLDNFYNFFKLYENYKKLNFNYSKKLKVCYIKNSSSNKSEVTKINYNNLNILMYYSTVLNSKSSFLYLKKKKILHKKKKLLSWTHNVHFLTNRSKRLGYIPHIRYREIRDCTYMWRINSRKLRLLTKYYWAKRSFYKKNIKFYRKYKKVKLKIISYIRIIDAHFFHVRKSMQKDLPLISCKRYLKWQLKKVNRFIISFLKRQKRRWNFLNSKKKRRKSFKWKKSYRRKLSKTEKRFPKTLFYFIRRRFNIRRKSLIEYVKFFVESLFELIFKLKSLRIFYIKRYQMNIMGTRAKLFKNLFNYRLATGFKVPFLVKIICKKLNFDNSLVGCRIGFFGRYSRRLRNRKIWKYIRHIKPSVINTPLDYYNVLILQKWGITGIKLSMLKKKTFRLLLND